MRTVQGNVKPRKERKTVREVQVKDLVSYFYLSIPIIAALIVGIVFAAGIEALWIRISLIILFSLGVYFHFKRFLLGMILMYKAYAPMEVRDRCRYTPTCSTYALISIMKYGIILGCTLAAIRICHCHPPYGGEDYPSLSALKRLFNRKHK